ncbi:riboflavin kinase/FMN adenylyltransferase [Breoghania corrubedonensis]|uniref:Riboflavin biosynthesis protein n=1 Tax=Breoghania corrubedonensis TaxID=665038 RepID=A0A2T5VEX5_9HYPH|nr:bifunctional riboflavin kinase/FAD synthetase [Breoghania corrubedonensis]PTW62298.1 riboflavin kinase/FMN adenylyltransferase [Breoghania corrubedonensis]
MPHAAAPAPKAFHAAYSLDAFPGALKGGVVGIGNFDGVHRGHQAVLEKVREEADRLGLPGYVMTFEPHPRAFFTPQKPLFRLTPPHAKAEIVRAFGLEGLLVLPFDASFALREASDFVERILVKRLSIVHAVTGYDFHFGRARAGTPDYLRQSGDKHGFGVSIVDRVHDEGGETISSSRIRKALSDGEIALANGLLGYRWFAEGAVRDGDKRGRELGYPTANIALNPDCALAHGIYAVRTVIDGVLHNGVANFGRRPTFDNGAPLLEVHVFDFAGNLYGKTLEVSFVSFLRGEEKFDTIDALIVQMDRDSEEARAAIAALQPLSPLDLALYDIPRAGEAAAG